LGKRDDVCSKGLMIVIQKTLQRYSAGLRFLQKSIIINFVSDKRKLKIVKELLLGFLRIFKVRKQEVGKVLILGMIFYPSQGEKLIDG
jgi:hypothetical protein